jgi:heterodisulfide reductase subunit B
MIAMRSGMDLDDCLKHAIEFVRVTTGPLFNQLNPEKLGEYSRALSVGTEYGAHLLRRFTNWDDDKRAAVLERLVHGYPSHEYIIDYHELQEIGFAAKLFEENERAAVQGLFKHLSAGATLVECVVPTRPAQKAGLSPQEVAAS